MQALLGRLGLHLDQQSLSNLWAKGLGLAGLVAGGFLNPSAILHDGFGIVISDIANGRIKWWAVAIGAVVTYITSQNTDPHYQPPPSGRPLPVVLLPLLLGAGVLLGSGMVVSSCKTTDKITIPLTTPALTQAQVDRVVIVLKEFEWSVKEAGSVEWLTPEQTAKGVDILETTIAGVKATTVSPIAAAEAALTAAADSELVKGTRLEIYLRGAVTALELVKQFLATASAALLLGGFYAIAS
jgi:hypothetical protein